jgi:hypothetical protein
MSSALDTTRRRGGKNMWGRNFFFLSSHRYLSTKSGSKASEEGGSITFSFNFPFPLEAIFRLPPSTYVSTELERVYMKTSSILSFKGISRVGVLSFK